MSSLGKNFVCVVALLSSVTACSAILGIEDATLEKPSDIFSAEAGTPGDTTSDAGKTEAPLPDGRCSQTCAPLAPAGWDGPFALSEASSSTGTPAVPACGSGFDRLAFDAWSDLSAPAASCGCTCAAAVDMTCPAPTITLFDDNNCASPCSAGAQTISTTAACTALDVTGCAVKRVAIDVGAPAGGSCLPKPSSAVAAPTWGRAFRLCADDTPPTGTCASGSSCVSIPGAPQRNGTLCIASKGDKVCPAVYPVKKAASQAVTDDRACSACSCGSPLGGTCSGTPVSTSTNNTCGGAKATTAPQSCLSVTAKSASATSYAPTGASCAPSPVSATGSAQAADPLTICCSD